MYRLWVIMLRNKTIRASPEAYNRDNDNQEIRVVWNLKINKYLDVINHFFGEDSGVLIRYSFIESETGKTLVTAACSRMNGKQDFLEAGGMYEKIMRKPFEDLK